MSSTERARLLDVCEPQVIAFKVGDYALAHDLGWLDRLRPLDAVEAVILHASRVLEVLARSVVGQNDRTNRVLDNIHAMEDYHGLPRPLCRCLHRLRMMGNDVRHVQRHMNVADAEMAYVTVIHWLAWFFCKYKGGPSLRGLLIYNRPLDSLLPADLVHLVRQLDSNALDDPGFVASLNLKARDCPLLASPVLPALLIESLLDRDGHQKAVERLLAVARGHFGADVRLRQLEGLYHSKNGRLELAQQMLEAIRHTGTAADEETLGILAGVYKRCWKSSPDDRAWLKQSRDTYRAGWDQSGQSNTYLGLNAATLSLWLDLPAEARDLAGRVVELVEGRQQNLASLARRLHYWDQVTLAEGYLLLGRFDEARAAYQDAFDRFQEEASNIRGTRDQARRILERLGESPNKHPYL